ncbi:MAG: phosphatidylserine decarboxylase family protein [Anaerolineales bacterium]|nr:phosphatidylserine decarboxylase family protein [Anaerolineales bacterium]
MKSDLRVPGWDFKKYREVSIVLPTIIVLLALIGVMYAPRVFTIVIFVFCLLIWGLVLYFFRDPDREFQHLPNVAVSPGDGVVRDITTFREKEYLDIDLIRIGIFLSIFDVHVQRAPLKGEVDFVTHKKGKNHPAYSPAASLENDQIVMGIKTKYGMIMVKQISGILARKCFNFAGPGGQIQSGQRYGLIKFGSRVELFLPPDAKVLCSVGEKVKGGLTPVAEMKEANIQDEQ